jgi:arylsulfatase A-like enzyme
VLLTSDHGDMLGSQGTVLKRKPWEESIAVPGVVRYPAVIPAGGAPELLFSHADMVPTLLGLAGVEPPEGMDGVDLSEFLTGARSDGHPESVYLQSYTPTEAGEHPPWRGVRTERYTYARHADRPWLLYDNREDPFQQRNLIGSPEHASVERELDEATMAWFARTGDDWRERRDLPYR